MFLEKKNGQVVNKQEFATLPDGKRTITKYKRKRTLGQNAYLWCIYTQIANHIGEESDYIHGVLSYKYLIDHTKRKVFVRSTTSLDTVQFGLYLEKVINVASSLGIRVITAEEYKQGIRPDLI